MIARLRPKRGRDDGAAAVEFALLVPVLLMIVFGIIAFGLVLFSQISATHAAREAVRQIAVNNPNVDTCGELTTYLNAKSGLTPTAITIDKTPGGDPGDELSLTFEVPTSEGAVGALRGVTSFFPGGQVILPDAFTIGAQARIEESSPIPTGVC